MVSLKMENKGEERTDGDARRLCGARDVERGEPRSDSGGVDGEDVDGLRVRGQNVDEAVDDHAKCVRREGTGMQGGVR